jgi:hypothetical protein
LNQPILLAFEEMTHLLIQTRQVYQEFQEQVNQLLANFESHLEHLNITEQELEQQEASIKAKVSLLK